MKVNAANPYGDSSYILQSDSSSVLIDAKKELQKEVEALAALKEQQMQSANTTNKAVDETEIDDTENGQDSISEDDSNDDSDRKGMLSYILCCN